MNLLKKSMLGAGVAGMLLFSSCLKNNKDVKPDVKAVLFVLQAAPDQGANIYLNDSKASDFTFGYTDKSTASLDTGLYKIGFITPGEKKIAEKSEILKGNHFYSAILYADKDNRDSARMMLFEDDFDTESTSGGNTYLRFLQLTPDAENVSIMIDKDDFAHSRNYADNLQDPALAKFRAWPGVGTFKIIALDSEGDTIDQMKNVALQANYYNTLYLSGDSTATDDSLKVKLHIARSY